MTILEEIVLNKKTEVALKKKIKPIESFVDLLTQSERSFKKSIKKNDEVKLITEIKMKSPSAGELIKDKYISKIMNIYNKYSDAISVVTDDKYFGGSLDLLGKIRSITHLPVLCKDFIIDEYQVFEARLYKADAILLIASILDLDQINEFILTAKVLKMDTILEVKCEEDMEKAILSNAEIIGINNRNLDDFSIDLRRTLLLSNLNRKNSIIVSESGITTSGELKLVSKSADAVIIGTSLLQTSDIEQKIREFKNQN